MDELMLEQCTGIELNTEYSFDLRPVVMALRYNTYFKKANLKNVPRKDAVLAFADTIRYNNTLERLYLSHVDATEGFVELGEALKANKSHSIVSLDLSDNPMKDKGAIGLAEGLEAMLHGLTVLNLSHCGIQAKGMTALMNALENNSNSSSLVQLNISRNPLGTSGTAGTKEYFFFSPVNIQHSQNGSIL